MNKWLSNCGQKREERRERERREKDAEDVEEQAPGYSPDGEYVLFKTVLPHPLSAATLRKNLKGKKKKKEKENIAPFHRYLSFNHRLTMYNLIVYLPWKWQY